MEAKQLNENSEIYREDFIDLEIEEQIEEENNTPPPPPNSRMHINDLETNLVSMPATIATHSSIVNDMTNISTDINGWNGPAIKTISNWYNVFREYCYVYQYVLDINQKMASRLNMVSTISSSTLGIFSAFKLWMNNEQTFRTTSDIILMMFNFGIAILTTASKRYLDDSRNEKIRIYIEEIDQFVGEISAQLLKMPEFRMNAIEFLNKHNDTYTKLITQQPGLSITELTQGKKLYKKYLSNFQKKSCNNVSLEIKTKF